MHVDIGNALDAEPRLTREALARLDERVATAHERIERGRADAEYGYAALNLPDTADPEGVRRAVDPLGDPDAVLVVGIGGSALGAATLAAALGDRRDDAPAVHVLDNVDPAHVRGLLDSLPLDRTALVVVSRSGTTTETLANFLTVRAAMDGAGVDWTERTLVVTGEDGTLRALAADHALPVLDAPAGVPGRFSVLSTVALPVAALAGHDVDALLAGARAGGDRLAGSLFESPAYAYGATCYALDRRGAGINAVMPYAESLDRFAEWFAQLWAESLGKDALGQTPVRALGATDQHSQLQLYRAGPRDKLVTLVRPRERPDLTIPETDLPGVTHLGGTDLGTVMDAEFEATEASLAAADCPNVRIEIERADERGLGELLYGMEAACVLYGELAGVETFTQPAVEWGKRAARGLLGGDDTPEADAVGEKRELVVE